MAEIDFGDGFNGNDVQDIDKNPVIDKNNDVQSIDKSNQNNNGNPEDDQKPADNQNDDKQTGNGDNQNGNSNDDIDTGLDVGVTFELDGQEYHVDENKNIVDADGNIFKHANEVADFLKNYDVDNGTEETPTTTISTLKEKFGDVVDENGNSIEFEDTPDGIESYVNNVLESRSRDIQAATINSLFESYPVVKDFINYLQTHNGDAEGFTQIRDRSSIELDANNEAQLVAIIKEAAEEFGNKTIDDVYINFLKDTGKLYEQAKSMHEALVQKDNDTRERMEYEAQQAQLAREQETAAYWNHVAEVVNNRKIGEYELPKSTVITRNGVKTTVTTDDFFKYISTPVKDKDGNVATAYQFDKARVNAEERLNAELLDAWVTFTGGSYKNIVDMAINKENANRIKITAKTAKDVKPIKFVRKSAEHRPNSEILFD